MKYDSEFVEFVVREVIRRLQSAGSNVQPSTTDVGRELAIQDRLVTLATLQGKLDGVSRLSVVKRAIVTPAVRDELSRRQIELKRQM